MRYSLFAGGKRVRPILAIAATEAVGGTAEDVLPMACALECIHTYSLIHDDLPALDNDDYRRGRLTNHKVFGEANAILAGDALLTFAFELMGDVRQWKQFMPARVVQVIHEVAHAIGTFGMIGGQVVDLQMEGQDVELPTLQYIHAHKTGALIRASVRSGAILGGGSPAEVEALTHYGTHVGLAFQIVDDILDVEGASAVLGKTAGKDAAAGKPTYPALYGLDESRRRAEASMARALEALDAVRIGGHLPAIARWVLARTH
jgi:geranylgeranyl diphosphate synthase, type II